MKGKIAIEDLVVFATMGQSGFGDTRKRSVCSGPMGGDADLGQGHGLAGGENGTDLRDVCEPK